MLISLQKRQVRWVPYRTSGTTSATDIGTVHIVQVQVQFYFKAKYAVSWSLVIKVWLTNRNPAVGVTPLRTPMVWSMQAAMCGRVGYCSSRICGFLNSATPCSRLSNFFSFITAIFLESAPFFYLASFLDGGGVDGGGSRGITGSMMLPNDES